MSRNRSSATDDVACWHQTDMPTVFRDVRFQGQSGRHLLALSFSGFDPACVKTPTSNLRVESLSRLRSITKEPL
jgi:hypothetical protein